MKNSLVLYVREHKMVLIAVGVLILVAMIFLVFKNNSNINPPGLEDGYKGSMTLEDSEHYLGRANSPIKIIEYSEGECVFCKRINPILKRIISENTEDTALVFRHFPLTIHPKAFIEAMALECAAEIGGESFFWSYLDRLFEVTPSNNDINLEALPEIANFLKIDKESFNECLSSGRYKERVQRDIQSGLAIGVKKIPYLALVAPNGQQFILGTYPSYESISATIEIARSKK